MLNLFSITFVEVLRLIYTAKIWAQKSPCN